MTDSNNKVANVVFPIKYLAKNNDTGKQVQVVSNSLVNTSSSSNGKMMIMYTDGHQIFCKDAAEFSNTHTVVTEEQ